MTGFVKRADRGSPLAILARTHRHLADTTTNPDEAGYRREIAATLDGLAADNVGSHDDCDEAGTIAG